MSNKIEFPSKAWEVFYNKLNEFENIPVKDWKANNLLGYFCKKYKDKYGVEFALTISGAPSKSYEVSLIKKMGMMIDSNPEVIKEYIDWSFQKHVEQRKKKITSLGFFTHKDIVNDFKFNVLIRKSQHGEITRSTILPDEVENLMKENNLPIHTWGDLSFYYLTIKNSKKTEDLEFIKLISSKINIQKLENVS